MCGGGDGVLLVGRGGLCGVSAGWLADPDVDRAAVHSNVRAEKPGRGYEKVTARPARVSINAASRHTFL
jgi:hypothetical protein